MIETNHIEIISEKIENQEQGDVDGAMTDRTKEQFKVGDRVENYFKITGMVCKEASFFSSVILHLT
jgi:hypothetical protein